MNLIKPEGAQTEIINNLSELNEELAEYFKQVFNVKEEINHNDPEVLTYALGTTELTKESSLILKFLGALHETFKGDPIKVRVYPEVRIVEYEDDGIERLQIRARLGRA